MTDNLVKTEYPKNSAKPKVFLLVAMALIMVTLLIVIALGGLSNNKSEEINALSGKVIDTESIGIIDPLSLDHGFDVLPQTGSESCTVSSPTPTPNITCTVAPTNKPTGTSYPTVTPTTTSVASLRTTVYIKVNNTGNCDYNIGSTGYIIYQYLLYFADNKNFKIVDRQGFFIGNPAFNRNGAASQYYNIPKNYFSVGSLKTLNYVFQKTNAGVTSYIGQYYSSPITIGSGQDIANTTIDINFDCK